jgi:hypothetical protein
VESSHELFLQYGATNGQGKARQFPTAVGNKTRNIIHGVHNTARRNTHIHSRRTIYQQLNTNAERWQFPHTQLLTSDDDQFG